MDASRKKQSKSKSNIASADMVSKDNSLGETLLRSTKTSKKRTTGKMNGISPVPNEPVTNYRSQCPCDLHHSKQLIERQYTLHVDEVFDSIFGSNDFVRTYRQAQRFFDETETEWTRNETTNFRERVLKYKVPYEATLIGKSTLLTREEQKIFHEVPGSHYVIETEVFNEGVRYCDGFFLILRFCLVQISAQTSQLRVTAQVSYLKSINGLIKQIIERNAYTASQEGLKDLHNRLVILSDRKIQQRLSNGNSRMPSLTITQAVYDPPQPNRIIDHPANLNLSDNFQPIIYTQPDRLLYIVVFLMLCLLLIHLHLYLRLTHVDFLLDTLMRSRKLN